MHLRVLTNRSGAILASCAKQSEFLIGTEMASQVRKVLSRPSVSRRGFTPALLVAALLGALLTQGRKGSSST